MVKHIMSGNLIEGIGGRDIQIDGEDNYNVLAAVTGSLSSP